MIYSLHFVEKNSCNIGNIYFVLSVASTIGWFAFQEAYLISHKTCNIIS